MDVLTNPLMIVLLIGLAGAILMASRNSQKGRERIELLRSQNFEWYRAQFPDLVKNGKVKCYRCAGESIHIEKLLHQTQLRMHTCRTCGTTLYYSSENG